jgi:thiamine-phosphate pyrophosphorylase
LRATFLLYIITDRKLVRDCDLVSACEAALAGGDEVAPRGSVAIQLREKDLDARPLYELAVALRAVCSRHGAPLLINERIDVAIAANADGVHLPFDSVGPNQARKLLGPDRLIGTSTHSPPDVAGAAREGADFVVFGPVFDPLSKSAVRGAWGPDGLHAACGAAQIPVYALGGITPDRIAELYSTHSAVQRPAGVAGIGSLFQSGTPREATSAMLLALMRR